MLFRIIKKSLSDKPIMNCVVFLFIIMASTFLSSSVNNLLAVSRGVDYYLELTNIPDFLFLTVESESMEPTDFLSWVNQSEDISNYEVEDSILIKQENITQNGAEYQLPTTYIVQRQSTHYMQVYNLQDKLLDVKPGEIGVPLIEQAKNGLEIGDIITLQYGSVKKDFKLSHFTKDSLCGSSLMGLKRFIINDADYSELSKGNNVNFIQLHSIESDNPDELVKDFKKQNFYVISSLDKNTVAMIYIIEKLISAILIIISLSLILISFCILRFTIQFSIQEEYKQIGIMKGIGIKNRGIQQLYLMKFMAIAIVGSIIGLLLSIPFQRMLLQLVSQNIIFQNKRAYIYINILCSLCIIIFVSIFSILITKGLNRFSVMDAIRNGNTGERFHKRSLIKLHTKFNLSPVLFLAINDILTKWKQYLSLVFTFTLGIILIIIPLNAVNTLKDDKIISIFGIQASDVFLYANDQEEYLTVTDTNIIKDDLRVQEEYYAIHNIPIKLHMEIAYSFSIYSNDPEDLYTVLTLQGIGCDYNNYFYTRGSTPKLDNEIALGDILADKLGVTVGDTIHGINGSKEYEFLITGTYQSMNNMGESMRLSQGLDMENSNLTGVFHTQGFFTNRDDIAEQIIRIRELSPDTSVYTAAEYIEITLGDIATQVSTIKQVIIGIILSINGLITLLMMRLFSSKEQTEIAMLKSLGYSNASIKKWQTLRIMIVLVVALLLGIILSYPLTYISLSGIFTLMGANKMTFTIKPTEVFLKYPLLIFVVTTVIAYFSIGNVKNVSVNEIKHME